MSAPGTTDPLDRVRVRGARENNLRSIDVDVPRDALVAFTGVSGSGKSSLAFGTLYAEAQRRYFESVAPYARRLIDQVGVPDVDSIEGLPPAVALPQRRSGGSARSTVGSATTLSSVVRMVFSRIGAYPEGAPMLLAEDFSANTVQGACPSCHGIGRVYDVPDELMVPDDSLSIRDGALAAWPTAWHGKQLRDSLISLGHDIDAPWRDLPAEDRDWILHTPDSPQVPVWTDRSPAEVRASVAAGDEPRYMSTFLGVRRYVLDTFAGSKSARMRERAASFVVSVACPVCGGRRLKPDALAVTFEGLDITELSALPLEELVVVARRVLEPGWTPADGAPQTRLAAQRLVEDLVARLAPIVDLGLGHLSLDRSTPTLSSGELQRMRLATQVLSRLFGVVFVLDEPSTGLHPADTEALLGILRTLRATGNTVFFVEHSLDVIREADWIVDIGPGAGSGGGTVVYSGPLDGLPGARDSVTRRYLFPEGDPAPLRSRRTAEQWIELAGVSRHTLDDLSVAFPVGVLTAVTGVSGSGKSTLVNQALPDLLRASLRADVAEDVPAEEGGEADPLLDAAAAATRGTASGPADRLRRVVQVTQTPIGRTSRSNVATYTGLFDRVRTLFAATPEAKRRRFSASRFSFNLPSGRCPVCKGEGSVEVELLFLPTVEAPCTACGGTRYNDETLEVTLGGRTIADVLALSVADAREAFAEDREVARHLDALVDVGLGYVSLGQPAPELSGGEAQRVKLASELRRAQRGDTLYLLDEPTSGLHPADADRLLEHLQHLVDAGNTVIVVEHDMRVVADADWVVDLGPGAGRAGGSVVATGTPEEVAEAAGSRTAPYLRAALDRRR
ncbi:MULTISPECIES: excinuclease ABC subunit UvrA [unclassified Rathayibacter]|uniref:excinuclease ABC subunit UvrA n=1 Tax=unclassified Rathayibacter TaxID=2609250 RepID=UPI000CE7663F|nr:MULTISPECIES: excinuclease ABC subunit UvrA [unclassified Rathayibacter]PPF18873.1 excinuclease ABC subunit A [Rathayibacter sp. AY1A4]PPG82046.1 excinuclease ABC subunit A [Rathayibacter sp. AY1E5]PPH27776.1 excinuclease ABC subunit A [Rathayibacter sp. AY1C3]PPH65901.1 excinuclease ABC subunit A [Rathayibacter sp. AY1D7]PPI27645.1 excinuclease ABC subunit A [Rathayibacter sp. AY1B4]